MSWLSRVANVFRASRLDQALDEELSFHIESRIEELVSSGVPRGEAALGGILGLLVAYVGVPGLVSVMPAEIPRADEIRIDQSILAFTLGLGLLTGLVFGAVPALRSSWRGAPGSMRVDDRGSSASLGLVGSALVVGEIAVAVLLVIGAGPLIRSFAHLLSVDPGFRSDRIVTARITLPAIRYAEGRRAVMFYDELLARVGALPSVEAAEATSHLPLLGGGSGFAFEVEGRPYVQGTAAPTTAEHSVTPGYLEAMAIPVFRGRSLAHRPRGVTPSRRDQRGDGPPALAGPGSARQEAQAGL